MGRNTQRRHAKAVRRKNVLAERRRLEMTGGGGSLAKQVRRARNAPLHACLAQNEMFETGLGTVILARRTGAHSFAVASFLVDVYCLGVKDAFFRELEEEDLEALVEGAGMAAPLEAVDPSYARKLLRDAVAYARSLGLEPPADYASAEALFGDVAADACTVEFTFGYQGKPLYVPGPTESPTLVRRRLDRLSRKLGPDGFVFGEFEDLGEEDLGEEGLDDADEAADGQAGYDPAVAPDPEEWLALDAQERIDLVLRHHRRAGVSAPNDNTHAVLHAIVENQIAMGDEMPVQRAVERLMAEGLDRHEAVHAVGSVLAGQMNDALKDPKAHAFPTDAYSAAIERLTAESWRREFGEADDED